MMKCSLRASGKESATSSRSRRKRERDAHDVGGSARVLDAHDLGVDEATRRSEDLGLDNVVVRRVDARRRHERNVALHVERVEKVAGDALLDDRRVAAAEEARDEARRRALDRALEGRRERDEARHERPVRRPEVEGPLDVEAALRVRDEADLLGRALRREVLDEVGDVLGRDLDVAERPVRQRDPADVELRARRGEELDVGPVCPGLVAGRACEQEGRASACRSLRRAEKGLTGRTSAVNKENDAALLALDA